MKNLCFDENSSQTWEFDNQFIDGIKSRYGNDFNYELIFIGEINYSLGYFKGF